MTATGAGSLPRRSPTVAGLAVEALRSLVLLFDNGAYGNVQRLQQQRFGPDRTIASALGNPDWVPFGESFGVRTERAGDPEALQAVLEGSLTHPGPSMVVVDIGDEPDPWPLLRVRR